MRIIAKITAIALCLAPTVASAEKLSLDQISAYLNQLVTAKGPFTQTNPDRSTSRGIFMIKRPGRMRFEYAKPSPALVVASSGQVAVFDKKSRSGPQMFPLITTPLRVILKKDVRLRSSGIIIAHVEEGKMTKITAQDPRHPNYGNIQLLFSANPITLRKWIVTDKSGRKTTVVLGDLENGVRLSERLFDIEQIAASLGQNRNSNRSDR